MTNPISPGALRAAELIFGEPADNERGRRAARIIDESTGLPELLEAAKECQMVAAACFRVINEQGQSAIDSLESELKALNIPDGFGLRASCAISKSEGTI